MSGRGTALWRALLPVLLLAPLLYWGGGLASAELARLERERAEQSLVRIADTLQGRFEDIRARLDELAGHVEQQTLEGDDIDVAKFDEFAAGLHTGRPWIRTFQVVSNGIIIHTYPITGNEKVLGYNLLKDPRAVIGGDLIQAKRTGRAMITGPIELVQGGMGLIIRLPIEQDNRAVFHWVAIIVDLGPLLASADIIEDSVTDLQLALRRDSGEVFFGQPEVFAQQPVARQITAIAGEWEIAGYPVLGWQAANSPWLRWLYAGGAILILLLSMLFYWRARRAAG